MTHDDDTDDWPVLQLRTTAKPGQQDARMVSSVFDLARFTVQLRSKPAMREHRHHCRVERTEGVTRCTAMQPQETNEWKEREAARRARQTPPKPSKAAKTMSKGFAALVGMAA